jgi:hypothetical protein
MVLLMQESTRSPLRQLVFFLICLSIAGFCLAGVHYLVIDLPVQDAADHQPANGGKFVYSVEPCGFWQQIRCTLCILNPEMSCENRGYGCYYYSRHY